MSDMISLLHLSFPVVESTLLTVSITPPGEKVRSYPWQSFVHILNRNYFFCSQSYQHEYIFIMSFEMFYGTLKILYIL